MPIVKVIEVIAFSARGIDDAIQNAMAEAARTAHNIDSVFAKNIKVQVIDGQVSDFGVIFKISFRLDEDRAEK